MRALGMLVGLAVGLAGMTAAAAADEVIVYAPGGLAAAMTDIAASAVQAGHPFKLVVGHSPAQARQLAGGAPGDVFISADPQWMAFLADRKLLDGPPRVLAATNLVVIAPKDSPLVYQARPGESLAAALGDGRLGLGEPDTLPSGRFARAALQRLGAWQGLEGRMALLPDVRTVVAMAERGEIAAGVAFSSDLGETPRVRVVAAFPADVAPPVVFPMAVLAGRHGDAVEGVAAFLAGPQAAAVFKAHGFAPPPDGR